MLFLLGMLDRLSVVSVVHRVQFPGLRTRSWPYACKRWQTKQGEDTSQEVQRVNEVQTSSWCMMDVMPYSDNNKCFHGSIDGVITNYNI
jgi:hypothetical protein